MDGATQTTDQPAAARPDSPTAWPIVAAAALFVGAIGPWVRVSVLGSTVTASGYNRDGIIVLIAAVPVLIRALVRGRGWSILDLLEHLRHCDTGGGTPLRRYRDKSFSCGRAAWAAPSASGAAPASGARSMCHLRPYPTRHRVACQRRAPRCRGRDRPLESAPPLRAQR